MIDFTIMLFLSVIVQLALWLLKQLAEKVERSER